MISNPFAPSVNTKRKLLAQADAVLAPGGTLTAAQVSAVAKALAVPSVRDALASHLDSVGHTQWLDIAKRTKRGEARVNALTFAAISHPDPEEATSLTMQALELDPRHRLASALFDALVCRKRDVVVAAVRVASGQARKCITNTVPVPA